jgi:hypothetical protein
VVKKNLVVGWVDQLGKHVSDAVQNGGFDRETAHQSRSAYDLDEKGWNAIAKELLKTLERIERIGEDAQARIKKDPSIAHFRATAAMMLFEGPSQAAGLPEDAGIRRHKRRRTKARA